ncbi:multidrug transporter MatE [Rickettsia asiatica]|uniref:Multidrug transporter MatE n=1 Tax=Rickettsia asiatica TaxID=238800 RepID=A0A510GA35_9RICK|nr:AbrB/MazE/SpoVT family DNA-binding domain-containing protein [Rickettsia asiatica]BBJ31594.1 multidrug transporter MatE [Rickettsia asiatica]
MKAQIQQWGNSLGVRIPQVLARKLHFKQGIVVNLEITDDGLFISAKTSELDILLDDITDANRHHEVFNSDDTVGNESW